MTTIKNAHAHFSKKKTRLACRFARHSPLPTYCTYVSNQRSLRIESNIDINFLVHNGAEITDQNENRI
jgi:hypothetical protein